MLIDCETCRAPATACGDCLMTTLQLSAPLAVELDDDERTAISVLTAAGLVPPLRLVVGVAAGFDADLDPADAAEFDDDVDDTVRWTLVDPADALGLSSRRDQAFRGIA